MTGIGPDGFPAEGDDRMPEDGSYDFGDGEDQGEDEYYGELAPAFRPVPGGAVSYFEPTQARVVRSLVSQVADLIRSGGRPGAATHGSGTARAGAGSDETGGHGPEGQQDELEMMLGLSGNDELPDDPVLARLLPDAYSDDPEAAADFRRYTEESLRSGKIQSAETVLATLPPVGGEVRLNEAECQLWLRALNDVRLAVGVTLGITEEDQDLAADLSADDWRAAYLMVYQLLTILQDSLLEALT